MLDYGCRQTNCFFFVLIVLCNYMCVIVACENVMEYKYISGRLWCVLQSWLFNTHIKQSHSTTLLPASHSASLNLLFIIMIYIILNIHYSQHLLVLHFVWHHIKLSVQFTLNRHIKRHCVISSYESKLEILEIRGLACLKEAGGGGKNQVCLVKLFFAW